MIAGLFVFDDTVSTALLPYASIHEKLQHYQCVMKEHLISIAPQNVAAIPVVTKRPKYSKE